MADKRSIVGTLAHTTRGIPLRMIGRLSVAHCGRKPVCAVPATITKQLFIYKERQSLGYSNWVY